MTPANAARCLGLLQGQKQSELTRDPGSFWEGGGKDLDPDLEPRLAASQGSTRRQVIQLCPRGLYPKVTLEVMGKQLKFLCSEIIF